MVQKKHYPEVNANPNFPEIEEKIISFWKKEGIFAESVDAHTVTKDGKKNEFVFYDGPPFANGLPHYGHLLTGFVKDIFARYQTMQGKRVERRFGWDCHGLPAEMGAEKELGISGRYEIEKFGIDKFNEVCRTSVMKYTEQWEQYVTRQARWVDFKNDYKTMDRNYMESILWAFKQLWDKGLVYESMRVMPYSWACETPLSNFETRMDNSYRERVDKAVTVGFELEEVPEFVKKLLKAHSVDISKITKCKILAWTTTPWTLPSNLALAVKNFNDDVDKNIEYGLAVKGAECFIASSNYIRKIESDGGSLKDAQVEFGGDVGSDGVLINGSTIGFDSRELIGLTYKPLFPYFAEKQKEGAFKILAGDFIEEGSGTGIVHLAPGFGEDDFTVCKAAGIPLVCPVDNAGKFTAEIYDLPAPVAAKSEPPLPRGEVWGEGFTQKAENIILSLTGRNVLETNDDIIKYLKSTGSWLKTEQYKHNYPHCWRTDTPLIYKAVPSWYVEVTKFKDQMVELNQKINWIPSHIRDGQFGKWLENARDWSISRNRYWGAPIPVWKSDNPKSREPVKAFGSIAQLEEFFNQKIEDLHRPFIDLLTLADDEQQPENPRYFYKRVSDVFDCWFESGSMPFAQVHYPFENKEWFEDHFSADFIVEYVAQTRGWFYTLMVLHTALHYDAPYNKDKLPPFKNVICHGVVLDDKGQKLSKRLNNYADPMEIFDKFGADAMRWVMISAPIMNGGELLIDKEGNMVRDAVRLVLKPLWNAYNFFTLYANADGIKAEFSVTKDDAELSPSKCDMDRYITAKCALAIKTIEKAMDSYDTPSAAEAIVRFFEILNNQYIRLNKERFWKSEHDADKQDAYNTLYSVIVTMCKAIAPLLPLTTEKIYQDLTGGRSVHLADFPDVKNWAIHEHLIKDMDEAFDICNAALAIRSAENIRVRQPLASLKIVSPIPKAMGSYDIIKKEVNVREVLYEAVITEYADYKLKINFPVLGKRLPVKVKDIIAASKQNQWKNIAGKVEIAGELLLPEEFSLQLEPKNKKATQALPDNQALVIIDLHITDELRIEGVYRDLVRLIQQSRKDADLEITQRIELRIETASFDIKEAVRRFGSDIEEQTLAVSVAVCAAKSCNHNFEKKLEGEDIIIGFRRVA